MGGVLGGRPKITRSSEYRAVYDGGSKVVGRYYMLFYRGSADGLCRLGITVSRKVGGAVVRNRVKRRTRAALEAVMAADAPPADMVFVALGRIRGAAYDELTADIKKLVSRVSV